MTTSSFRQGCIGLCNCGFELCCLCGIEGCGFDLSRESCEFCRASRDPGGELSKVLPDAISPCPIFLPSSMNRSCTFWTSGTLLLAGFEYLLIVTEFVKGFRIACSSSAFFFRLAASEASSSSYTGFCRSFASRVRTASRAGFRASMPVFSFASFSCRSRSATAFPSSSCSFALNSASMLPKCSPSFCRQSGQTPSAPASRMVFWSAAIFSRSSWYCCQAVRQACRSVC